jgi:hypothetical protein
MAQNLGFTRTVWRAALIGVLACALSQGQVFDGVVSDSVTGAPIAKAEIKLSSYTEDRPSYSGHTGSDGHFRFAAVGPGDYQIEVSAHGYTGGSVGVALAAGRTISILHFADGRKVTGAVIRLAAEGVITGRVTDADGEALPEASVLVVSEALQRVRQTKADERGEYRVSLAAGRYYLVAGPREDAGGSLFREDPGKPEQRLGPIYYPGTSELPSATALELPPGQHLTGIDWRLRPVTTYHVRGTLTPSGEPWPDSVLLRNLNGDVHLGATQPVKSAFDFGGVAPGSYWLEMPPATRVSPAGRLRIDVTDHDVEGVRVPAELPFELIVSVRFAEDAAASHGLPRLELAPVTPLWNGSNHSFSVGHNGRYGIPDMRAGVYTVRTQPAVAGVYVQSATYSGRSAAGNQIDLTHGPLADLEIVLATDIGTVTGTAADPQLGWAVLVSADGPTGNTGARFVRIDESGRFEFHSVPAGHWLAFAVSIPDEGHWQSREYVQQMADRGVAVVVEPAKTTSVEVKP